MKRFYKNELPNVDDMVVVKITREDDHGYYGSLIEYDNIEGYEKPVGKNIKVGGKKIRIGGIIPYSQYDNYILPVYYYINNYLIIFHENVKRNSSFIFPII